MAKAQASHSPYGVRQLGDTAPSTTGLGHRDIGALERHCCARRTPQLPRMLKWQEIS